MQTAPRPADAERRYRTEVRLTQSVADGGGLAGLVATASAMTPNPLWLIDPQGRVVTRSRSGRGSDFRPPDVTTLLAQNGPADLTQEAPLLVAAKPALDVSRRHLLMPVRRGGRLFAWLVMAEVSSRFGPEDAALVSRTAFHLASEYSVQRRVARSSWNARATLARALVRGNTREDDLATAAEYLGVQIEASRVIVYLADPVGGLGASVADLAERMASRLDVEVLGTRGREGTILLVEAPEDATRVTYVHRVKQAVRAQLVDLGHPGLTVGVSSVSRSEMLQRAYRETREVVLCVDRFAGAGDRVIAVDDLGPARLFVANGDVGAVRRYVQDVIGPLLVERPGVLDLLRTLQCFFDTGRSVRESSVRLGVHENTVRLRLAKVHDLTGLDVASDANDQLSAQTALLVLRLQGHAAIPSFDERHGFEHAVTPEAVSDDSVVDAGVGTA